MARQSDELIAGNAYKIFVSELELHLANALRLFCQDGPQPSLEDARTVGRNFHTVRGGAGFFGFKDMSETARQIEVLLLKAEGSLMGKLNAVRQLLETIEKLSEELPPPRC